LLFNTRAPRLCRLYKLIVDSLNVFTIFTGQLKMYTWEGNNNRPHRKKFESSTLLKCWLIQQCEARCLYWSSGTTLLILLYM
jgi:hypothetical protein